MTGVLAVGVPDGPVAGLLLPVDGPARVIQVAAIGSDAAAGSWRWPVRWVDTVDGCAVAWCGERRNVGDLPANAGAWVLVARLGCPDLADRIALNGDLLVVGVDDGRAGDVPEVVVRAAWWGGLLVGHAPGPEYSARTAGVGSAGPPPTQVGRYRWLCQCPVQQPGRSTQVHGSSYPG